MSLYIFSCLSSSPVTPNLVLQEDMINANYGRWLTLMCPPPSPLPLASYIVITLLCRVCLTFFKSSCIALLPIDMICHCVKGSCGTNVQFHFVKNPVSKRLNLRMICRRGSFHLISKLPPPLWRRSVKIYPLRNQRSKVLTLAPLQKLPKFSFPLRKKPIFFPTPPPSEIFKRSKAPTQPPPQK